MEENKREVIYNWYHHMAVSFEERKRIGKIIDNHDFEAFCKEYIKWNSRGLKNSYVLNDEDLGTFLCEICYFPSTAYAYTDENGEELEEPIAIDILQKEGFDQITANECECG